MHPQYEYIKDRVHALYYGIDLNCARTTITIISEIKKLLIHSQTMDAALGLHGGGGFRGQCGLVEGGLMLIGIMGKEACKTDDEIVKACYNYCDCFSKEFGAISCKELRPGGFKKSDPPHLCEGLSVSSIEFTLDYLEKWLSSSFI